MANKTKATSANPGSLVKRVLKRCVYCKTSLTGTFTPEKKLEEHLVVCMTHNDKANPNMVMPGAYRGRSVSPSLRFNGHLPGEPGSASVY